MTPIDPVPEACDTDVLDTDLLRVVLEHSEQESASMTLIGA